MCHGSKYKNDATKYRPNVASKATTIIPPPVPLDPKKLLKKSSTLSVLKDDPAIPRIARYIDKTMRYALITPKTMKETM